ncbi:hypothetical protein BABINDRAFT_161274 [Babjeviella inositovora NRRL Y-12698]|uniref:Uncharacterized protein n=1 Tax=Babjeviella inositovora NRRL Y-12698 TaxID=984486 RepID=A0A1E3QRJ7_9ASCO|nr:uncharacterized protein BABINDRAFT_161274 [Babjeviella inositovora NRRL Y-12698]ODQ80319.1 hypothetical protein BABINDRAFT_161274 [Babjeviella inositovora NRRL Y-12698]
MVSSRYSIAVKNNKTHSSLKQSIKPDSLCPLFGQWISEYSKKFHCVGGNAAPILI